MDDPVQPIGDWISILLSSISNFLCVELACTPLANSAKRVIRTWLSVSFHVRKAKQLILAFLFHGCCCKLPPCGLLITARPEKFTALSALVSSRSAPMSLAKRLPSMPNCKRPSDDYASLKPLQVCMAGPCGTRCITWLSCCSQVSDTHGVNCSRVLHLPNPQTKGFTTTLAPRHCPCSPLALECRT